MATGLSGRAGAGYRIASSSRETSEDWVWVQQTGELAIASPACGAFAGRGIDEERLESVADIDMVRFFLSHLLKQRLSNLYRL